MLKKQTGGLRQAAAQAIILTGTAMAALPAHDAKAGDFSLTFGYENGHDGSYTYFSPKTFFSRLTKSNCSATAGMEVSAGGSGQAQFFLAAKGRLCEGEVQPDPDANRRFFAGMIGNIPQIRDYVESEIVDMTGMSKKLVHQLLEGSVKVGDLKPEDVRLLSDAMSNALEKMGVDVPPTLIGAYIDQLPDNAGLSLTGLSKMASDMAEFIAASPLPNKQELVEQLNEAAVVFNRVDNAFTGIRNADSRNIALNHIMGAIPAFQGGADTVPEIELIGGVRVPVFTVMTDNWTVGANVETYVGFGAQYWDVGSVHGYCLQPKAGARVNLETRFRNAFSVGAYGGAGINAPCVFGNDSLYYNDTQYYNLEWGLYAKYTLGANPFETNKPAVSVDDSSLELSVLAGAFGSLSRNSYAGAGGFTIRDVSQTQSAGIELARRTQFGDGVFGQIGMESMGGMIAGKISPDQGTMRNTLNDLLPTSGDMREIFEDITGFSADEFEEKTGYDLDNVSKQMRADIIREVLNGHYFSPRAFSGYSGSVLMTGTLGKSFEITDSVSIAPYVKAGIGLSGSVFSSGQDFNAAISPAGVVGVGLETSLNDRFRFAVEGRLEATAGSLVVGTSGASSYSPDINLKKNFIGKLTYGF